MEQIIEAMLRWLKEGGFLAVRQMPEGLWLEEKEAVVAVGAAQAEMKQAGLYCYLGQTERGGKLVSVYGRQLLAALSLEVICARTLGAEACRREADRLLTALSGKIPALAVSKVSMQGCRYDGQTDCFGCGLRVEVQAYLYALANEDETEFTDFILKGVVR